MATAHELFGTDWLKEKESTTSRPLMPGALSPALEQPPSADEMFGSDWLEGPSDPSVRVESPEQYQARTLEQRRADVTDLGWIERNLGRPTAEGYHRLRQSLQANELDARFLEKSLWEDLLGASAEGPEALNQAFREARKEAPPALQDRLNYFWQQLRRGEDGALLERLAELEPIVNEGVVDLMLRTQEVLKNADPELEAALQETEGDLGALAKRITLEQPGISGRLALSSLTTMAPSIVGMFLTRGRGAGVLGGLNSYMVDRAGELLQVVGDAMQERELDPMNPDHLAQAFADPEIMADAREKAGEHAAVVGIIDGLTAAYAARSAMRPGMPVLKQAREFSVGAAGGAGGELGGTAAAGGDITSPQAQQAALIEALAEGPTTVVQSGAAGLGAGARATARAVDRAMQRRREAFRREDITEAERFTQTMRDIEQAPDVEAAGQATAEGIAQGEPTAAQALGGFGAIPPTEEAAEAQFQQRQARIETLREESRHMAQEEAAEATGEPAPVVPEAPPVEAPPTPAQPLPAPEPAPTPAVAVEPSEVAFVDLPEPVRTSYEAQAAAVPETQAALEQLMQTSAGRALMDSMPQGQQRPVELQEAARQVAPVEAPSPTPAPQVEAVTPELEPAVTEAPAPPEEPAPLTLYAQYQVPAATIAEEMADPTTNLPAAREWVVRREEALAEATRTGQEDTASIEGLRQDVQQAQDNLTRLERPTAEPTAEIERIARLTASPEAQELIGRIRSITPDFEPPTPAPGTAQRDYLAELQRIEQQARTATPEQPTVETPVVTPPPEGETLIGAAEAGGEFQPRTFTPEEGVLSARQEADGTFEATLRPEITPEQRRAVVVDKLQRDLAAGRDYGYVARVRPEPFAETPEAPAALEVRFTEPQTLAQARPVLQQIATQVPGRYSLLRDPANEQQVLGIRVDAVPEVITRIGGSMANELRRMGTPDWIARTRQDIERVGKSLAQRENVASATPLSLDPLVVDREQMRQFVDPIQPDPVWFQGVPRGEQPATPEAGRAAVVGEPEPGRPVDTQTAPGAAPAVPAVRGATAPAPQIRGQPGGRQAGVIRLGKPETPAQAAEREANEEAYRRAGLGRPDDSVTGTIQAAQETLMAMEAETGRTGRRAVAGWLKQKMLDRLYGIKAEEERLGIPRNLRSYMIARLAMGWDATLTATIQYGSPELYGGAVRIKPGSKGLLPILAALESNEEIRQFFGWMVANRAKRLLAEGRERNLTADQIDRLQEQAGVRTDPNKLARFESVRDELAQWQGNLLDFAEQTHLLDPALREAWRDNFYLPFYRMTGHVDEELHYPVGRGYRGFSHQEHGIRRLTGGKDILQDPLANVVLNAARLIKSGVRNHALHSVIRNLGGPTGSFRLHARMEPTRALVPWESALAEMKGKLTQEYAQLPGVDAPMAAERADLDVKTLSKSGLQGLQRMWAMKAPDAPNVVRVMHEGSPVYFTVDNPLLLESITQFAPVRHHPAFEALQSVMRGFTRMLTTGVTVMPDFAIRNYLRDAASVWVTSPEMRRPFQELFAGMQMAMGRPEKDVQNLMMAGGLMLGRSYTRDRPEKVGREMRQVLARHGVSPERAGLFRRTWAGDKLYQGLHRYLDALNATENVNRIALARTLEDIGAPLAVRAYTARDVIDFSMYGSSAIYQFMKDSLPFLNARVQGLYRLGRTREHAEASRVLTRIGYSLAFPSFLLGFLNSGRKEYDDLDDWDKDTYWHFFFDGLPEPFNHVRVPKPFELGLVFGTMFERMGIAMAKSIENGSLAAGRKEAELGKALAHGVVSTLQMDIRPQVIRPLLEILMNRNYFTGAPVDPKLLQPGGGVGRGATRFDEGTSPTFRALANALAPLSPDAAELSPSQLAHLVNGYLGSAGMLVPKIADGLHRMLIKEGYLEGVEPPDWNPNEMPMVSVFFRGGPQRYTKWRTKLYDMIKEVRREVASVENYVKMGEGFEDAATKEAVRHWSDHVRSRDTTPARMMRAKKIVETAARGARKRFANIRNVRKADDMTGEEKRDRLNTMFDEFNRYAEEQVRRLQTLEEGDF